MNYKANEIDWNIGDIIIHDADAKRENMLMEVIEKKHDTNKTHRYVCAYINERYFRELYGLSYKAFVKWNKWENSINPLHDTKRFNLNTPTKKNKKENEL